jgi:hypothetical protein
MVVRSRSELKSTIGSTEEMSHELKKKHVGMFVCSSPKFSSALEQGQNRQGN